MDKTLSCEDSNQISFDRIEKNVLGEMKHILKSIMATLKFNLIYSQHVSEEQEQKTAKAVKEYRNEHWNSALKQAKGDKDKAYKIYTKDLELLN